MMWARLRRRRQSHEPSAHAKTLLRRSALEQAAAIRRGEVSSEELACLYLERIERYNEALSAFIHVDPDRVLKQARLRDAQSRTESLDTLPVFHGVPTGIKDLVLTKGTPTKLGSRSYRYLVAPFDAPVARRIEAGGFVSLGKLSTSEFGVLPTTEPDIHPPTRNPWNLDHTPGGSSGGSGAAVAAGLIPLAHGSDGGGSVRIPSALCHLYGFKPSLSLLGNLHGKYNRLGISVMGPLGRYVRDAAAMLDVMAGVPDPHMRRGGTCLHACDRALHSLKIGLMTSSPIGEPCQEVVEAIESFANTLQSLGHEVVAIDPYRGTLDEFLPVWCYAVSRVPTVSERYVRPVTRWLRKAGADLSFEDAEAVRRRLAALVADTLDGVDVCLSPTVSVTAPTIREFEAPDDPERWFRLSAQLGGFTAPFNLNHGCGANIPIGLSESGLPIGAQLGARPGQDHLVLALSAQLEAAVPWHERWAPGYAPD